MLIIDEPVQSGPRVYLSEVNRSVRGKPGFVAGGKAPGSWIDLSPATTVPLSADMADDKELANFIAAERGKFRYDYVRLRCSFYPTGGEAFDTAWLEVALAPSDAGAADPPVAWSINPGSEFDAVEVTNSAKIGSKLKFISSEVSASEKGKVKLYSIRGYREGGANPFWEMKATDLADINGSFAFHLVVRSAKGVETNGSVKLRTVIGKRTFLIFHSEQPHAEEPVQKFILPAAAARR